MSAALAKKPKPKPQHIYARVRDDGALVMADAASNSIMRRKKIRRGMLVRLVVSGERNYLQWKRGHALGNLIARNIDDFAEYHFEDDKTDAHGALKKLQRLSGVECDDAEIELPGMGKVVIRQPRSLAFDEMDEASFQTAYAGFCAYLKKKYWRDLSVEEIESMASLVGDAG